MKPEIPIYPQPQLPNDAHVARVGDIVWYGDAGPCEIESVDFDKDAITIRHLPDGELFVMVKSK
jgi:hypothetical protein